MRDTMSLKNASSRKNKKRGTWGGKRVDREHARVFCVGKEGQRGEGGTGHNRNQMKGIQ